MPDDDITGDDFLRNLANESAQARRDTAHAITRSTNLPPTATHIGRRALVERLRAEWHAQTNTNTEEN